MPRNDYCFVDALVTKNQGTGLSSFVRNRFFHRGGDLSPSGGYYHPIWCICDIVYYSSGSFEGI